MVIGAEQVIAAQAAPAPGAALPLSVPEARRVLARAMIAVGRAADPHGAFVAHQAAIGVAMTALGRRFDVSAFLASCGIVGEQLHETPEAEPSPDAAEAHALPARAAQQLRALVTARFSCAPRDVAITIDNVIGSSTEGFDFTYRIDGQGEQAAFALPYCGGWVFAPGPVGSEDLDAVTAAFRRHFDILVALSMHCGGADDAAIDAARAQIVPLRALWPGERDPRGLCDDYPLVFVMGNATGNGREFYCGYDPVSGATEPYDFE